MAKKTLVVPLEFLQPPNLPEIGIDSGQTKDLHLHTRVIFYYSPFHIIPLLLLPSVGIYWTLDVSEYLRYSWGVRNGLFTEFGFAIAGILAGGFIASRMKKRALISVYETLSATPDPQSQNLSAILACVLGIPLGLVSVFCLIFRNIEVGMGDRTPFFADVFAIGGLFGLVAAIALIGWSIVGYTNRRAKVVQFHLIPRNQVKIIFPSHLSELYHVYQQAYTSYHESKDPSDLTPKDGQCIDVT